MNKIAMCLTVVIILIFHNTGVFAADKVVVIPLNRSVPSILQPIAVGHYYRCNEVDSYGVASCTINGTGEYTLTLNKSWTGEAIIVGTCFNTIPADEILTARDAGGGNKIKINISNGSGIALDSEYNFVVYANVQ